MTEEEGGGEDELDVFESGIEALFGQHQVASGKPGELTSIELQGHFKVQYRIPKSKSTKLFAHYQWDAGVYLASLIAKDDLIGNGKSILELGAGTGLPGLVAAKQGLDSKVFVVLTDYPDEGILAALKENIEMNHLQSKVIARGLDWTANDQIEKMQFDFPLGFDRIFAADVLWLSSSHEALVTTIKELLAKEKTSRCILVNGFHTGRRAISRFFKRALQEEFKVESLYEYNVLTMEKRQWTGAWTFPFGKEDAGQDDLTDVQDNMDDFTERTKWLLYVSLQWR